jgi:hypothetical protein
MSQLGKGRVGTLLEDLGNLKNAHEIPTGGEKPFAASSWVDHRLEVQFGDVADTDSAEADIGAARHGAVQETLHEHDRG